MRNRSVSGGAPACGRQAAGTGLQAGLWAAMASALCPSVRTVLWLTRLLAQSAAPYEQLTSGSLDRTWG